MTVSTDGQICYGIRFEEGFEFPWDAEKWDDGIDDWWLYEVCGYENPFELFDGEGNWINGVEPPDEIVDQYYEERRRFEETCPIIPVELVNYCSCDCDMYILAIPDSVKIAHRGYPKSFRPLGLSVSERELKQLLDFCEKYGLEGQPMWWLSSLWC